MPLLLDVGPKEYQFSASTASLTLTPLADRAALVTRIGIGLPSANDTWIVSVGGKEIMRFRIQTTGNQNPIQLATLAVGGHPNFFDYCRNVLGVDPSIPVPQGQTMTITSVGGATAPVLVEFEEHSPSDYGSSAVNHYLGTQYLIPVFFSLAAAQTAVGPTNCDTQVGPAWLPNFLIGTVGTPAWALDILALFFEGAGVNTFSGAANHQSATSVIEFVKNSVNLGSRTTTGWPNVGSASAAGSANTVLGQLLSPYLPFQHSQYDNPELLPVPVHIGNGDLFNAQMLFTGDLTGGASYATAQQLAICKVTRLQ